MIELTSGTLSIVILICAIISIILYFLNISWVGLYVCLFVITSVINCAAQAYWAFTSRTSNTDDDDEVEGAAESGYTTGGAPSKMTTAELEAAAAARSNANPGNLSGTGAEQRAGGATKSPAPANAPTNAPTSYPASPNHRSGGHAWGGSPRGRSHPINGTPSPAEQKYCELKKLATETPKVEPSKITMPSKSGFDPLHDESGDDFTTLDLK